MTPTAHNRPARGAEKSFQPLEKNFPTIGKNGAIFPTIGKNFSNHWKKPEIFFQSLENRRKIFPIVGKLLRPGERAIAVDCNRMQSIKSMESMLSDGLMKKGFDR